MHLHWLADTKQATDEATPSEFLAKPTLRMMLCSSQTAKATPLTSKCWLCPAAALLWSSIGEDSLEANVGHFASLTGGQIFVAAGADVTAAVRSALRATRAAKPENLEGVMRSGMEISAEWSADAQPDRNTDFCRAVTAYRPAAKRSGFVRQNFAHGRSKSVVMGIPS